MNQIDIEDEIMWISCGQKCTRGVFGLVDKLGFVPEKLKASDNDAIEILDYVHEMMIIDLKVRSGLNNMFIALGVKVGPDYVNDQDTLWK